MLKRLAKKINLYISPKKMLDKPRSYFRFGNQAFA